MFRPRTPIPFLLLLVSFGCGDSGRAPATGEGFVAPATLNIRRELGPREPAVATVKHGERVEIIGKRRRFLKVRTTAGVEGWIDGRLLFSPEQMADLRGLAEQAGRLPSQGGATAFETLNVHTHPNRQSPSFIQLKEGDHVEVLAHRLSPRVPFNPEAREPDPDLSASIPMDDWSLIRTADGRAGWALFRMLVMAIPDEVAQYAEGHRITSYFSLGEVRDRGQVKHNWLWTTVARGLEPYQFDSFRVFVWSLSRHRYETAFIERNVRGYYPVRVLPPLVSGAPSFSLIVEEDDGQRYERTYAFQGYRVRLIGKKPWTAPPDSIEMLPSGETSSAETPGAQKSFFTRLKERLQSLRR